MSPERDQAIASLPLYVQDKLSDIQGKVIAVTQDGWVRILEPSGLVAELPAERLETLQES